MLEKNEKNLQMSQRQQESPLRGKDQEEEMSVAATGQAFPELEWSEFYSKTIRVTLKYFKLYLEMS